MHRRSHPNRRAWRTTILSAALILVASFLASAPAGAQAAPSRFIYELCDPTLPGGEDAGVNRGDPDPARSPRGRVVNWKSGRDPGRVVHGREHGNRHQLLCDYAPRKGESGDGPRLARRIRQAVA